MYLKFSFRCSDYTRDIEPANSKWSSSWPIYKRSAYDIHTLMHYESDSQGSAACAIPLGI